MEKITATYEYRGFKVLVIAFHSTHRDIGKDIKPWLHLCMNHDREWRCGIFMECMRHPHEDFLVRFQRMIDDLEAVELI